LACATKSSAFGSAANSATRLERSLSVIFTFFLADLPADGSTGEFGVVGFCGGSGGLSASTSCVVSRKSVSTSCVGSSGS